ncbi:hypothetical protein ABK040_010203 [Willaertia magna]
MSRASSKSSTKRPTTSKSESRSESGTDKSILNDSSSKIMDSIDNYLKEHKKIVNPKLELLSDYFFVHQLRSKNEKELHTYLSQSLQIDDYMVNLKNSILLDFFVNHLNFCKEHSFNTRQTIEFLNLLETLRKGITFPVKEEQVNKPSATEPTTNEPPVQVVLSPKSSKSTKNKKEEKKQEPTVVQEQPKLEAPPPIDYTKRRFETESDIQEFIKKRLLELSRPLSQEQIQDIERQLEEEAKRKEEERLRLEKESKKNTKTKSTTNSNTNNTNKPPSASQTREEANNNNGEDQQRQQIEQLRKEELRSKTPLYNMNDITLITEYILTTIIQHLKLYRYIFEEEQPVQNFNYSLEIDTIENMVPLAEMKKKEEYEQFVKEMEKKKMEEEEMKKKAKEEERLQLEREAEERYKKEKEERSVPKLLNENLREIAEYLKCEISQELDEKFSIVEQKLKLAEENLQNNSKTSSKPSTPSTTKRK